MKTFKEKQLERVNILKAEYKYREEKRTYALSLVNEDRTDKYLDQLMEAKQDYLIATMRLTEAERALNYYERYSMWETAEFKKEYTG